MTDLLLVLILLIVAGIGAMVVMLYRSKSAMDIAPLQQALLNLQQANDRAERAMREEMAGNRREMAEVTGKLREELAATLSRMGQTLTTQLTTQAQASDLRLDRLSTAVDTNLKNIQADNATRLDQMREQSTVAGQTIRNEVAVALKEFKESLVQTLATHATTQSQQMEGFSTQLSRLISTNEQKLEAVKLAVEQNLATVKLAVEQKLEALQADNARQLEQMRLTVDEKLQTTLNQRLGESFKQVSERLEAVYKGLGEMQTLATGVGDLKKVLTNVRTRGTWGEMQLGAMLEQVLTPDQFVPNFQAHDGGEFVEFAIKLPGRSEDSDEPVYLPIDAKFPTEDYQRLVDAHEAGDLVAAEEAGKMLEIRIKGCAQDICNKYINPPKTTDFAILFLPTEGLFAEVVRRAGLTEFIQQKCRVNIAGPTTLWSVLNSLQMGFRTLAIQKRSGEVWNLLSTVKTEWSKYEAVLAKVQKKLSEASNEIGRAEQRTRVIGRKLKNVQELPVDDIHVTPPLLLDGAPESE